MENVKETFRIGKVYDHEFNADFPFSWDKLMTYAEVQDELGEPEVVTLVNASRRAGAKATEYAKIIAPFKPKTDTAEYALASMIKGYQKMVPGASVEEATTHVNALLAAAKAAKG